MTTPVIYNTGNNEWYTPEQYILMAKKVMGGIDTDPCSCVEANKTVQANIFFDMTQNGLGRTWRGSVFMNPPYGRSLVNKFVFAFINKYHQREFKQGIVLTNASTDTRWCQKLLQDCDAYCFKSGRIKFNQGSRSTKAINSPPQGSLFTYFGDKPDIFVKEFKEIGFTKKNIEE